MDFDKHRPVSKLGTSFGKVLSCQHCHTDPGPRTHKPESSPPTAGLRVRAPAPRSAPRNSVLLNFSVISWLFLSGTHSKLVCHLLFLTGYNFHGRVFSRFPVGTSGRQGSARGGFAVRADVWLPHTLHRSLGRSHGTSTFNHRIRITEWFGLEDTSKFQPSATGRGTFH